MKIICAPDSFKDSMTAEYAAQIMKNAVLEVRADITVMQMPLADGGEGTAETLRRVKNGEWVTVQTMGPLPDMRVESGFTWLPDQKTAVVEMAASSGLQLLKQKQRNPMRTTTFGTGELIRAAQEKGAETILLAVGGSATVDMGIGMASALGWQFRDAKGECPCPVGGNLEKIVKIIPPATGVSAPIRVMCDVENPLLGEQGAARVYAPQKGASQKEVAALEAGLEHMASLVNEQLNIQPDVPRAGASGGLSAGAVAFLGAKLESGIEAVLKEYRFSELSADADWILTGEGRFDVTSLRGKVISGLLNAAGGIRTKFAVFAGKVDLNETDYQASAIDTVRSITPEGMPLQQALKQAPQLLHDTVDVWAREVLIPYYE